MAIKLPNLKTIADERTVNRYAYKDLHLDITKNDRYIGTLAERVPGSDIKVDYDELAIRNSLRNLFNTRKGQRFLFPRYGLDLYQYLFEPISELNARSIGEDIVSAIKDFEPRVDVVNVSVIASPDENLYEIDIVVNILEFKRVATIYTNFELKTQSFVFFESTRNR